MTKPYSEDLRTRVVAAVVAGASCRDAAQRFSIRREQCCAVGAAVPADRERRGQADGRGAQFASQRRARLATRPRAAAPDLPLHDIRRELAARNVRFGYGTIWRFFAKEKITFKKNRVRRRAGPA